MINLNSKEYDLGFQLTAEKILELVSDYQIFKFYIPEMEVGKAINSPLRKDIDPSFSIFYSERYNKLLYKDFTGECADCFIFVSRLYGLNYYQALVKICMDFNLELPYKKLEGVRRLRREIPKHIEYDKSSPIFNIGINEKPFTKRELDWWLQYNITKELLDFYNVKSCKRLFLNQKVVEVHEMTFAFLEFKDRFSYKLYSPLSVDFKWLTNHDSSVIQGFRQLPLEGDLLIISKSLKDIMTLSTLGYYSISPQSESSFVKDNVLEDLKRRFKRIVIYFDNDLSGRKLSKKFSQATGLEEIYNPIGKEKDPSDYLKERGEKKLKLLIEKMLY